MNKYAHEMTFKELSLQDTDVPDYFGRPIRRSDDPRQRWLQWQKGVQAADRMHLVSRDVMDYFQATKHLGRPPREGDHALLTHEPLGKEIIIERDNMPRFTWSPSKLMDFETCPAMFAAKHYYHTVPYEETEATIWGTRVHKAAELHMTGLPVEDVDAYEVVRPYCQLLDRVSGNRLVEYKIGLKNWKPADWQEADARMIVDLAIKDGETLKIYDWKTGKIKDDHIQLQIYAYAAFILFPEIKKVESKYIWLKERKTTGFNVSKAEILPIAKDIRERVARMKQAWDNENFSMRKNGLCKKWCQNLECPYCGRGR